MAETLTYQESEPTTEQVVLNEAEQEALAVGEQMEREQGTAKLAGKFESPEQLEKAYLELQSKMGSNDSSSEQSEEDVEESEETEESESTDQEEEETDISFLDELYAQAFEDTISPETIKKLEELDSKEIADMYVQYRQQVESQPRKASDFTEDQVNALYGLVGGQEQYGQLISWAQGSLSQQEVQMFDAVISTGDPNAAFWAIRSLAMQYADANGYEGKRISGKAPTSSGNQFRSQAELVKAMSDPRYETDDAYRADVMSKLENSELNF